MHLNNADILSQGTSTLRQRLWGLGSSAVGPPSQAFPVLALGCFCKHCFVQHIVGERELEISNPTSCKRNSQIFHQHQWKLSVSIFLCASSVSSSHQPVYHQLVQYILGGGGDRGGQTHTQAHTRQWQQKEDCKVQGQTWLSCVFLYVDMFGFLYTYLVKNQK